MKKGMGREWPRILSGEAEEFNTDGHGFPRMDTDMGKNWNANEEGMGREWARIPAEASAF
jgi:hypothetical protein